MVKSTFFNSLSLIFGFLAYFIFSKVFIERMGLEDFGLYIKDFSIFSLIFLPISICTTKLNAQFLRLNSKTNLLAIIQRRASNAIFLILILMPIALSANILLEAHINIPLLALSFAVVFFLELIIDKQRYFFFRACVNLVALITLVVLLIFNYDSIFAYLVFQTVRISLFLIKLRIHLLPSKKGLIDNETFPISFWVGTQSIHDPLLKIILALFISPSLIGVFDIFQRFSLAARSFFGGIINPLVYQFFETKKKKDLLALIGLTLIALPVFASIPVVAIVLYSSIEIASFLIFLLPLAYWINLVGTIPYATEIKENGYTVPSILNLAMIFSLVVLLLIGANIYFAFFVSLSLITVLIVAMRRNKLFFDEV